MFKDIAVAGVESESIDYTSMTFSIIDDHIVAAADGVDGAHDTLITVIEEGGVFFSFKSGQFTLQLFVVIAVSAHHARAHRCGHAEPAGGLGVNLTNFGMIGESQVVVQAPDYFLFSTENHAASNFTFQLWEGKITVCSFSVLADRAVVFY